MIILPDANNVGILILNRRARWNRRSRRGFKPLIRGIKALSFEYFIQGVESSFIQEAESSFIQEVESSFIQEVSYNDTTFGSSKFLGT